MKATLCYENGQELDSQTPLQRMDPKIAIPPEGITIVRLRINDVSKNHQSRLFAIRLSIVENPYIKAHSVMCTPILVLSKRTQRSLQLKDSESIKRAKMTLNALDGQASAPRITTDLYNFLVQQAQISDKNSLLLHKECKSFLADLLSCGILDAHKAELRQDCEKLINKIDAMTPDNQIVSTSVTSPGHESGDFQDNEPAPAPAPVRPFFPRQEVLNSREMQSKDFGVLEMFFFIYFILYLLYGEQGR